MGSREDAGREVKRINTVNQLGEFYCKAEQSNQVVAEGRGVLSKTEG